MENGSKLYRAKLKSGMSIITVIADGYLDAASKIELELHKNESRMPLWYKWLKDGMLIEVASA